MPFVVLSPELIDECRQCAAQRDYNRRSSIDYSSDRTNDKSIWSFMGVLGEVALLRYFKLDIDWEYLSTDKGFCGVDVGDIWEVRAMSKYGNRLFLWSDEVTKSSKLAYKLNTQAREAELNETYSVRDDGSIWKFAKQEGSESWKRVHDWIPPPPEQPAPKPSGNLEAST